MILLVRPLGVLALAGFMTSVIVHLCSLLGLSQPFGKVAWGLHVGVFFIGVPVLSVMRKSTRGAKQIDIWKAALQGGPGWFLTTLYGLFVYAFVNFFIGIPSDPDSEVQQLRLFSGHWMAFYFAAFAVLWSAACLNGVTTRCSQGHACPPLARFCKECGTKLPSGGEDGVDSQPTADR